MKKMIGLLLGIASVFTLASCDLSALMGGGGTSENSQTSQIVESVGGEENSEHKHKLTRVSERKATCTQEGNITHWTCDCGAYFADAMGKEEVTAADVILAKEEHVIKYTAGIEPNCSTGGRMEYWSCSKCLKNYADEACTQEVKLSDIILTAEHTLVHQEAKPVVGREDGVVEHWACSECGSCFADAEGTEKMKKSETVIVSVLGIPDFVVEVPAGRDPIVLQLSDTQIIDAAQERPGRGGIDRTLNATDKMDERCFNYLEEVITATNPDFIILTGDVVYGEFDDDGSALTKLVDFMDGFQIPWSPVFGNHDNESKKGADWQCDLFENSQYCLFDQKELSGNGNYSVGIAQDGEMKRVFYMLDTHACGNASQESKDNGHTLANRVGFQQDQMDWYTEEIKLLKKYVPEVKISFAYHIQQWIFGKAYASYGFNQSEKYQDINLDMMEGVAESDFGYIGRQMKGEWDTDYKIYKAMKELGVDSIFVGHEHCNNVSVVYEGIRFTYGLKSSEYDRFNWLNADGTITGGWIHEWNVAKTGKPLVGGTVTVLSEDDGEIEDCYNYYCGFENGEIDWDAYKPDVPDSVMEIPDFLVEVPVGRDPIVLQLSDTQIIDAAQERPGRGGVDYNLWATDQIEERCFDYLTEVITATNPDFIIITGDVIYGEFDDNGTVLPAFIEFMDSFQIPWSPVFGNHDNESAKGVDWQCAQLEASEYCYFEQNNVSGNGNYSVGIAQGGELLRVFYMMDSNACGNATQADKDSGKVLYNFAGFKQDQIDWYTNQIKLLKKYVPDVKISFAYHIQQAVFGEAYAKYGFNQSNKYQDINLDTMDDVAESDFGYIGRQMKGPWDTDKKVYNAMKTLGVDSIFVGHEHCNNVSVIYDGIRFTYGLKSSEYDRFNFLNTDGTVGGNYGYAMPKTSIPLVGGTVIVLSEDNGTIEDCYNYYCGFENGKINWDDYKPAEVINVNGLQYGGINATTAQMWGDGPVYAEAVKFDDTTNAWKVTAGGQGKLYINTSLLKGKTTLTFSLYIENALGSGALDPFSLRVKPDNDSIAGLPGAAIDSNSKKQYIQFKVGDKADADAVRLQLGVWQTFTVDISKFADVCTELSFNIYTGNTLYLKDIALS